MRSRCSFAWLFLLLLSLASLYSGEPSAQSLETELIRELLLLPAPATAELHEERGNSRQRETVLDRPRKAPPENAPLEILALYWARAIHEGAPPPTQRVSERLLEAVEANPDLFAPLVKLLPRNPDALARTRAVLEEHAEEFGESTKEQIVRELKRYHPAFREHLVKDAQSAGDDDKSGSVDNGDELKVLAEIDWPAAQPILERYATGNGRRTAVLATSLLYRQAVKGGKADKATAFRKELKAVVEN